jgi:hypothetical protein
MCKSVISATWSGNPAITQHILPPKDILAGHEKLKKANDLFGGLSSSVLPSLPVVLDLLRQYAREHPGLQLQVLSNSFIRLGQFSIYNIVHFVLPWILIFLLLFNNFCADFLTQCCLVKKNDCVYCMKDIIITFPWYNILLLSFPAGTGNRFPASSWWYATNVEVRMVYS